MILISCAERKLKVYIDTQNMNGLCSSSLLPPLRRSPTPPKALPGARR